MSKSAALNVIVLSIGATLLGLAFVGLSSVAFGGWRPMLADPARASVCAALIALAAATPLCGCNLNAGLRSTESNDWIFPYLLVAGLGLGWVSAYSDRHNWFTLGGETVRLLGVCVFVAGIALRVSAMLVLGSRFSVWVAVQHDHRLQTTGLYRFVRHPSYTGAFLMLFGWAITFRSAVGLLLAAMMMPPLVARMAAEEVLLVEVFSEQYESYRKRSWRLVPLVY